MAVSAWSHPLGCRYITARKNSQGEEVCVKLGWAVTISSPSFVESYSENYEAIRREWEESREVFNRDDVAEVSTVKITSGSFQSDV